MLQLLDDGAGAAKSGCVTTATAFHRASGIMTTVAFIVGLNERFPTVVITMIIMMVAGRTLIGERFRVVCLADFTFRGNRWYCQNSLTAERDGARHDEHAKPGKHRYT